MQQSATPEQVQEAIRSACRPILKLDDDF
jgi:hypothetical protein